MSTIRVAHRPRFTAVARSAINDVRLSFKARGVLTWLLDKPDGWRITREGLVAAGPDGHHSMRGALAELVSVGYLVRERRQDERGRWVTESVLHEVPPKDGNRPAEDRPAEDRPVGSKTEVKTETTRGRRFAPVHRPPDRPAAPPAPFTPLGPRPPIDLEVTKAALARIRAERGPTPREANL